MASIRLDAVGKTYGAGVEAVRDVDLEVRDGELVVLVGPSGCGKSTVLRLVAGLETPERGRVLIGGRDVTALPPQDRDLAMVFQSYALYPHKTVRRNLEFGLRMHGVRRAEIAERVARVARALGLASLLDRRPAQLSGGQRQRVALGRAIAREPRAFLLDEPLSNLDAHLRLQMRAELKRLHGRLSATMLYVTHDQEEALTLADRLAVMRAGAVEQVGPPMEVYREPATEFVGTFIGAPSMNLLRGSIRSPGGGRVRPECGGRDLEIERGRDPSGAVMGSPAGPRGGGGTPRGSLAEGREVTLGIRPHDVRIVEPSGEEADAVGRVDVIEPLGSETLVHVAPEAGGGPPRLRCIAPPDLRVAVGERVGLRFDRSRLHLFDPADGRRLN
ncbi:MAG: ABC transporter ATP-binding protein [Acidobacteriota bacterium]